MAEPATMSAHTHQPGWSPLIDPMPIAGVHPGMWYLTLIPLVLAVSVSYKAVRAWSLKTYWRQVFKLAGAILAATAGLALLLNFALDASVR